MPILMPEISRRAVFAAPMPSRFAATTSALERLASVEKSGAPPAQSLNPGVHAVRPTSASESLIASLFH
jgi:hypothetical protein